MSYSVVMAMIKFRWWLALAKEGCFSSHCFTPRLPVTKTVRGEQLGFCVVGVELQLTHVSWFLSPAWFGDVLHQSARDSTAYRKSSLEFEREGRVASPSAIWEGVSQIYVCSSDVGGEADLWVVLGGWCGLREKKLYCASYVCLFLTYPQYRKTPLISTYVFSGIATEGVLIFGGRTYFRGRGYDKAEWKILQGRRLFNPVLSVDNTLLCMFPRLCTSFQDTGVLIFGGYVLSEHCSRQQISVKNEGVLIFGGVLILRGFTVPLSLFLILLSLSLSLSLSCTHCCIFLCSVLAVAHLKYCWCRLPCLLFVWHFLFIVTHSTQSPCFSLNFCLLSSSAPFQYGSDKPDLRFGMKVCS